MLPSHSIALNCIAWPLSLHRRYNDAVGPVINALNNTQNMVNSLQNQYNNDNGNCGPYPWQWGAQFERQAAFTSFVLSKSACLNDSPYDRGRLASCAFL